MSVLFRGGRREAEEVDVAGVVEFASDAAGEGLDDSDSSTIRSSVCIFAVVVEVREDRKLHATKRLKSGSLSANIGC